MRQRSDIFVSPDWLIQKLRDDTISIIDGSWHLEPDRDPRAEYLSAHIPGAVFFDLDAIADHSTNLPHMLPSEEKFATEVGKLGVGDSDMIIVYDSAGLFSAARVWWTFKVMGASNVRLLDGGLPAWQAAGGKFETGDVEPEAAHFTARLDRQAIAVLAEMQEFSANRKAAILDARPAGRFEGRDPEPRAGLRPGHMPGALNLPVSKLIADGKLKPFEELAATIAGLGLHEDGAVVTTCGSGVTAAILYLALYATGHDNIRLYDGSWAEWGGRLDTDIVVD